MKRGCFVLFASLTWQLSLVGCIQVGSTESQKTLPTTPTNVTVRLNDEPLADAVVTFFPETEGERQAATGFTDAHGQAQMTTFVPGDGVQPGRYLVTVTKLGVPDQEDEGDAEAEATDDDDSNEEQITPDLENIIPSQYASRDESDLHAEVSETSPTVLTFSLVDPPNADE